MTCAPLGLECQSINEPDGGIAGLCALPGDGAGCDSTVGCTSGFACVAGVFQAQPSCVQACEQSSDCVNPIEQCVADVIGPAMAGCVLNACGPGSNLGDGGSINGTDFYAPCDAQGTDDGTCYPFSADVSPVNSGFPGFCQQAGAAAQGEPCGSERLDGGAPLCEVGSFCTVLSIMVAGSMETFSGCLPTCAATFPFAEDGGPGCEEPTSCVGLFPALFLGVCMQGCGTFGQGCPPPLVCLDFGGGSQFCGPG